MVLGEGRGRGQQGCRAWAWAGRPLGHAGVQYQDAEGLGRVGRWLSTASHAWSLWSYRGLIPGRHFGGWQPPLPPHSSP